jgi:hypothetical protein
VFICNSFGTLQEDMIVWGDAPRLNTSEKRTDEEARDRYTLKMDQYKCMQVSMARFTAEDPMCVFPDPQGLVQEVVDKGIKQLAAVAPRAFHHFTKTALVAEKDDETNKYKRVVKKVGIDPHFSYANMLCDVAWARSHGTGSFLVPPEGDAADQPVIVRGSAASSHPVLQMMRDENAKKAEGLASTCGGCLSFNEGRCLERDLIVQPIDPGCDLFLPT